MNIPSNNLRKIKKDMFRASTALILSGILMASAGCTFKEKKEEYQEVQTNEEIFSDFENVQRYIKRFVVRGIEDKRDGYCSNDLTVVINNGDFKICYVDSDGVFKDLNTRTPIYPIAQTDTSFPLIDALVFNAEKLYEEFGEFYTSRILSYDEVKEYAIDYWLNRKSDIEVIEESFTLKRTKK